MTTAYNAPKLAPLIPIAGAGGALVSAVHIDSNASSIGQSLAANERIADDLEDKTLPVGVAIQPGDKYEGLIFVESRHYTPQFTVIICQENSRAKKFIFEVDLHASFKNHDQDVSSKKPHEMIHEN